MSKTASSEIVIEFSKDQIQAVLKMLSPFRGEEMVLLRFEKDNIIFEIEQMGNTGKITLGSESVKPEYIGKRIFIKVDVLHKIHGNMPNVCEVRFKHDGEAWYELSLTLDGDNINIGLPIFDKDIDTAYVAGERETVLSEVFEDALRRTNSAMVSGASIIGFFKIGKSVVSGTDVSLAIYNGVFNKIESIVSPGFRPFLNNICKISGNVTMIKDKEGSNVIFQSENVEYKTYCIQSSFNPEEDIKEYAKEVVAKFNAGLESVRNSCSRLSIPLTEDTELFIDVGGSNSQPLMKVFDIQNRMSNSKITITAQEGEGSARVSIGKFSQCISQFKDVMTVAFHSDGESKDIVSALSMEDDKFKVFLLATI